MTPRLLPLLIALLLAVGLPAGGEIYRWVDDTGNVHFSDTKPENQESEQIVVQAPEVPAVPDEGELRRLDLLEKAREAWQREADSKVNSEPVATFPAPHDEVCRNARIDYGVLLEPMTVYRTEDGDYRPNWQGDTYQGKRNYVADDDRSSILATIEADIYAYCDDPTDVDAMNAEYNLWINAEYCAVAREKLASAQDKRSRVTRTEVAQRRREVHALCDS